MKNLEKVPLVIPYVLCVISDGFCKKPKKNDWNLGVVHVASVRFFVSFLMVFEKK
jgi:hypothetical protein